MLQYSLWSDVQPGHLQHFNGQNMHFSQFITRGHYRLFERKIPACQWSRVFIKAADQYDWQQEWKDSQWRRVFNYKRQQMEKWAHHITQVLYPRTSVVLRWSRLHLHHTNMTYWTLQFLKNPLWCICSLSDLIVFIHTSTLKY